MGRVSPHEPLQPDVASRKDVTNGTVLTSHENNGQWHTDSEVVETEKSGLLNKNWEVYFRKSSQCSFFWGGDGDSSES